MMTHQSSDSTPVAYQSDSRGLKDIEMSFSRMQFEDETLAPVLRFRARKSFNENTLEDSAYGSPGWQSSSGDVYGSKLTSTSATTTPPPRRTSSGPSPSWKSDPAELWGTVVKTDTFKELLPVAVAFLVMTSCVVLICTLTFGLDRDLSESGRLNGKYMSIDFAHRERMKRKERSPKFELKDEDGTILGGKRASIQFALEMKAKANPELLKPDQEDELMGAKNTPEQLKLPLDLVKMPSVDLNNVDSFKAWNGTSENTNVLWDKKEPGKVPEKVTRVKRSVLAEAGIQDPEWPFRFNKRSSGNKKPHQLRSVSRSSNEVKSSS